MRIAFVAYDWPGYYGGPIVNARRLLPELQRRGHEVTALLVYHGGGSPAATYLQKQGVACRTTPWVSNTAQQVRWFLTQVRDLAPDVFVPNISVGAAFAGHWVRAAGIPTVAAYAGPEPVNWGRLEQFVFGPKKWAVSGLTCCSDALRKDVEKRRPQHTQIYTLLHGVPIAERPASQSGPLRLVYAGRLAEEAKQITKLVGALCRVVRVRPEISATLIGEGAERSRLERMVSDAGLSTRIEFRGGVEPDRLYDHLVEHHVLVLLSDYEGLGASIMDGMACGLVPVSLAIPGGLNEMVIPEQTGLLVKDRHDAFLGAIERLADDQSLRQRLAANAVMHIHKHYSVAKCTERWESFLTDLVAGAPRRRRLRVPSRVWLPSVHPALTGEDVRPESRAAAVIRTYTRKTRHKLRQIREFVLPR